MTLQRALWHSFRYFFAAELFLSVANAFMWPTSFIEATIIGVGGGLVSIPAATLIIWGTQRMQRSLATTFIVTLLGITTNTIATTTLAIASIFHELNFWVSIVPALCTVAAICFCFKKQ